MDPIAVLERIAFVLNSSGQAGYRGRVFSRAARRVRELPAEELRDLVRKGKLRELEGVGPVIESVVREVLEEGYSSYLERLQQELDDAMPVGARALLQALRGDCHTHSDWSDGRATVAEMAGAWRALGHEYVVLTDHSPRLTIARGLSPERLLEQLMVVEAINERIAPARLLTGIEVDILEDGSLDQQEALLERLDVVVGSVHSLLRMPAEQMTPRLLKAVANPHLDILGHCTGRLITGRGRPESTFDSEAVFEACARHDKAVEINCRPERLDPPRRLLRQAVEAGCRFAVNTDAHTPEELQWQALGCRRGDECGVGAEQVVNTWPLAELLQWTASHST